jgi:hypothetical protein
MMWRIVDGRTVKMGIFSTEAPGARYPRVFVFDFISGYQNVLRWLHLRRPIGGRLITNL